MSAYDLPSSLNIGGRDYSIRSGWRHILKILEACSDPEASERVKARVTLKIFYPEWKRIPLCFIEEALEKACQFIDCGHRSDGTIKPKMIDWGQDAPIIIPEINKVARMEIRIDPDIHWWTFFGWFMGIGDGLLASVLCIRKKKAMHKKLDRWEEEFYRENKSLVDLKYPDSEAVLAEKASIQAWLNS